jgi:glycosyltransferase involved in cell wall biosynthesis
MERRRRPGAPGTAHARVPAEHTQRLDRAQALAAEERSLRIALLAPPWRPVSATTDGEVEAGLARLADALTSAGHDVTLFAAPGSRSRARVVPVLDRAHEREAGSSLVEADHVARAFAAIERAELNGAPFDLVHDHSGWTALAMADRLRVPFVHTVHAPFDPAARDFYRAHGAKAAIVCRSHAHAAAGPAGMRIDAVIPGPVAVVRSDKEDFLLALGEGAARIARAAGRPVVLADARDPRAVLPRARALLMPDTWEEPFGTIMAEAMAAGTPVIAPPHGAAPELIDHGLTGLLAGDEAALTEAVTRVDDLDPDRCRAHAADRFGPEAVAERHAALYRAIARPTPAPGAPAGATPARCVRPVAWRRPRPCARH